jgi:hypothetical protein
MSNLPRNSDGGSIFSAAINWAGKNPKRWLKLALAAALAILCFKLYGS